MTEFEKAVVEEVKRVRALLAQSDECHQMNFTIVASGRVHTGEVSIKFCIGDYSADVQANSVDGAVYEQLRRKGWERSNAPLMISDMSEPVNTNDDIPF